MKLVYVEQSICKQEVPESECSEYQELVELGFSWKNGELMKINQDSWQHIWSSNIFNRDIDLE